MAFQGDLSNVNLFDVFQTLLQNRQRGVLILQRGPLQKRLFISPEGVRLLSAHGGRPFRVGEIFVQRGFITPQDVEILLLEQKERYRPIGELIVATGKVSKADIDALLRYHAEDEIYDLFAWETGTFSFLDGMEPDDSKASPLSEVCLDSTSICLDAARRLDETACLRERIPTNEEFFTRCPEAFPDFMGRNPSLADLYEALHVPHSVDELRDLVGLTLFDVLAGLVELMDSGFIRPLNVRELIDVAQAAEDRGENDRAAILFEKAHRLHPDDLQLLEATIQAVQSIDAHDRLSDLFMQLGRLQRERKAIDEAIDAFERGLRSTPDRLDLLEELEATFAANEEPDRAVEIAIRIAKLLEDRREFENACDAIRRGLELVPSRVALRLHLAQLHLKMDRSDDARAEVMALIEDHREPRRNRHARELLGRCARLLLQIDPTDADAHQLIRQLESTSEDRVRRRQLVLRGVVIVAGLLLIAGVGITVFTGGAANLLADARSAQSDGDIPRLKQLVSEIEKRWPNSPEALEARAMQASIEASTAGPEDPQLVERRQRIEEALSKVLDGLKSSEYVSGIAAVRPFLDELNKTPLPADTRTGYLNPLTYALVDFLEKVERQCRTDVERLTVVDHLLKAADSARDYSDIRSAAADVDAISKRAWTKVAEELSHRLDEIRETRMLAPLEPHFERCRKSLLELSRGFEGIGRLQQMAIAVELRMKIDQLVEHANTQGMELLSKCDLDAARKIYQAAWDSIDSAYGYESSQPLDELKARIERDGIRDSIRTRLRAIETVQASLVEVERDATSDDPQRVAAAYARLRQLVFAHVRIGFGQRYRLPVHVDTRPVGAQILVNGEPAGTAPATLQVPIERETSITLRLDGFEEATARVDVTDASFDGLVHVPLRKCLAWRLPLATGVAARPVAVDGTLIFATTDCSLHAIDLATGRPRWPAAESGLLFNVQATPFVAGDCAVFVTTNGVLHRVRMSDGKIIDRYALGAGVVVDTAHAGNRVWLATLDRRLVCLTLDETVEKVFECPLATTPSTGLTLGGDVLAYGTSGGELILLEPTTGAERRRIAAAPSSSFLGGVATLGALVVAGAENGRITGWSIGGSATEPDWSVSASAPVSAPPLVLGGRIFVPTRDGILHVLAPDGGQMHADLGGALLDAQPAGAGSVLYLLGRDRVTAWNRDAQSRMWEYRFDGAQPRHVAATKDTVVVVTDPPSLIAFPGDG